MRRLLSRFFAIDGTVFVSFYGFGVVLALAALLSGCSSVKENSEQSYPAEEQKEYRFGKATGDDGLVLFGGKKNRSNGEGGGGTGIGVNAFLWKASLDTVSFMPLASADPFGGVILTEWYTPPQSPSERMKLSVFIQDKQLRADGLKVNVFRQRKEGNDWRDQSADPATARKIEDAILTRARQLRVESAGG
jgi:hypothetical protein